MSVIISPNMSLPVPVVGNEPGPQFATDVNNSLTIIDGHTHAAGSGVQITPSGLNINTSLPMNDNSLTSTAAITYQAQSSDASNYSSYMKGVDFYLRDGSGNVIRLTQSGSVAGSAGTITGLPSGTASASFGSGTFVFQSATNTAATIDGASYILRNNTANSFGLTLQPPNSLGSNYSLTLPSLPSQTNVMTLDNSGNMGSITYDAVGQNMTAVGANAIATTVTRTIQTPTANINNVAYSNSSGTFSTTSTSPVSITNFSVAVTISGSKPVMIMIVPGFSPPSTSQFHGIGGNNIITILNATTSTIVAQFFLQTPGGSQFPATSFIDPTILGSPGTYNYQVTATAAGSGTIFVTYMNLVAYELH